MTNATVLIHSRHTVSALQEMAGNVRAKAKDVEAAELHRAVMRSTRSPRDFRPVSSPLIGLNRQELLGLAVVLASRCPRPLMRPDDGVIDEEVY
jgi:hypothetical protein